MELSTSLKVCHDQIMTSILHGHGLRLYLAGAWHQVLQANCIAKSSLEVAHMLRVRDNGPIVSNEF